jgi:PASTA domain
MAMPAPARRHDPADDGGWPAPRPSVRAAPPPRGRARRELGALWLALLGLALAVGAGVWYLSLDRTAAPAHATMPRVVGLREQAAVRRLTQDGFDVRALEQSGPGRAGTVFAQQPAATVTLPSGATVTIRVSR